MLTTIESPAAYLQGLGLLVAKKLPGRAKDAMWRRERDGDPLVFGVRVLERKKYTVYIFKLTQDA